LPVGARRIAEGVREKLVVTPEKVVEQLGAQRFSPTPKGRATKAAGVKKFGLAWTR